MYSEMGVAKVKPPFIHYGLYENHTNYKILSQLGKLNDWLREHLGYQKETYPNAILTLTDTKNFLTCMDIPYALYRDGKLSSTGKDASVCLF